MYGGPRTVARDEEDARPAATRNGRRRRARAILVASACAAALAAVTLPGGSCACGEGDERAWYERAFQAAWPATQQPTPQRPAAQPAASQTPAPQSSAPQQAAAKGRVEYAEFDSASLGQKMRYAVSLPASYDQTPARRYPVVIFLHGLNNDERDWESNGMQARLDALRAAGKVGDFVVAMPYGGNSFYLNAKDGARYEDAVVKDFIPFVDKQYRTLARPDARLIEGISMGGYGALLIAFKHPSLFAGVAAHSAALFDELPQPPAGGSDRVAGFRYALATRLFGTPPDDSYFQANSPLHLARTAPARLKSLKIYFDVGDADRYNFQPGNRQLSEALKAGGVAHEFTLAPGGHGWGFLESRAEQALAFVWSALRPKT